MALKVPKHGPSDSKNARRKMDPLRTTPMPVLLSNSSEIAEKYDNYLRMLCKEHPSTMKKLRNEKKYIQEKKNILNSLIQQIKIDVKNMQSATQHLEVLYGKEKEFALEKEKEIFELNTLLQSSHERKDVLLSFMDRFSTVKHFLDNLAKANKFQDVTDLVRFHLILEALNEQFITLELQCMQEMKKTEEVNIELKDLLKEHQFELMKREKRYEEVISQKQNVEYVNSGQKQILDILFSSRLRKQADWEQIKRWINGICRKIAVYKEVSGQSKEFYKQLEEVFNFIEASKKILKH
ncbi:hypothetical protein CDAR_551082 [Caerostris darwini]|uniref:Uncharacterized protein n=1 Tax=Caerostris darwini TaxID=1538125 RepID=A0AAV4TUD9_9ARAC|nr:hypothetical protein CDAR_551082 [Caerostris darwini]